MGNDYDAVLEQLDKLIEPFEQRKRRAARRLARQKGRYYYFAVLGLETQAKTYDVLDQVARFRAVNDPPGEIELAAALREDHLFGAIGRYSHGIRHELCVSREFGSNDQAPFSLAWWIISCLRVRTLAELLIPAVADHSWSTIAAVQNRTCYARLLEDVPQARRLSEPVPVSKADLQWVSSHLVAFATLLQHPSFRLAVDALSTHHLQTSERMMAAMLWSGIEALFAIDSELRFRLSASVAAALESRGPARHKLHAKIKRLYDVRSKAVHGGVVSEDKLREHVMQVRALLSRLLCTFTEAGALPAKRDMEALIFT